MNSNPSLSTTVEITPRVVSEEDAARYLGISQSSLRKGRMAGRQAAQMSSPPFIKMGRRVGYLLEDLDNWLRQSRHEAKLATGRPA